MKKYLKMAALAVAVCGTFVSCHDDEIATSTIEQKIQAFEDVFTRAFGKPDPNHTWGFGDPIVIEGGSMTRAEIDANGNMWEDCPSVGPKERDSVFTYVNALNTTAKVLPADLSTYYVTHIYTGTDKHGSSNYENSNMNELKFAKTAPASITWDGNLQGEWFHILDFNAGKSTDFEGNMLVVNTPPLNFAYHNSSDSKWHDKWIGVDGADINSAYSDYYYICFDFEAMPNEIYTIFERSDGSKAYVSGRWPDATGQDLLDAGITAVYNGSEGEKTYTVEAGWKAVQVFNEHYYAPGNDNYTDWIIRLTKAKGSSLTVPKVKVPSTSEVTEGYQIRKIYTAEQVVKSGRVFCEDIVAAQYDLEDLDYNDVVFDAAIVHKYRKLVTWYYDNNDNLIESTDNNPNPKVEYDFNNIENQSNGYSEYYAKVCLLAAGGTLPIEIRVGDQFNAEVHNVLGNNPSSVMINTLDKSERERVNMATVALVTPAVDLEKETGDEKDKFYGITDINRDIVLNVSYGNVAEEIKRDYYNNQGGEVVASAKFMVPLGTPWAKERTNIAEAYPDFTKWVNEETDENGLVAYEFWNNPGSDDKFFKNSQLVGLDPEIYDEKNFVVSEVETDLGRTNNTSSSSTLEDRDPENPVIPTPTGTVLYDYSNTTTGPGYLYTDHAVTATRPNNLAIGATIRVYGVSIDGWEVKCNFKNGTFTQYASTNCGYIDIPVEIIPSIQEGGLVFTGKNFTITYVTLLPAGGGGNTLWEGSKNLGYGTDLTIEKAKFEKASSTSKIKFTATSISNQYYQIHIKKKIDQNNVENIAQVFAANDWPGSVTFTIGDYLSVLKNNDICVQGGGLTMTKIELIP